MNSNRDTASKIVLMALILLFPIFAAGIYLLVFRNNRPYLNEGKDLNISANPLNPPEHRHSLNSALLERFKP